MFYYKIRQHNNTHSPLTAIKQTLTTLNHRRLCLVSKILKRTDIFTGELVEHYVIIRRSYRCDKQSTITRLRNGLMFTKLHSRQSCTPIPNNCSFHICVVKFYLSVNTTILIQCDSDVPIQKFITRFL